MRGALRRSPCPQSPCDGERRQGLFHLGAVARQALPGDVRAGWRLAVELALLVKPDQPGAREPLSNTKSR